MKLLFAIFWVFSTWTGFAQSNTGSSIRVIFSLFCPSGGPASGIEVGLIMAGSFEQSLGSTNAEGILEQTLYNYDSLQSFIIISDRWNAQSENREMDTTNNTLKIRIEISPIYHDFFNLTKFKLEGPYQLISGNQQTFLMVPSDTLSGDLPDLIISKEDERIYSYEINGNRFRMELISPWNNEFREGEQRIFVRAFSSPCHDFVIEFKKRP